MEDRNDNKIGKWSFDVWLTESGNLGFTVYEPGKSTNDEDAKFIDIRINAEDGQPKATAC